MFLFNRGKAKAGDRVLVHGASGAVGLAACQMAKAHGRNPNSLDYINLKPSIREYFFFNSLFHCVGMTVVGTAGTPQGMELVKNNGAHLVFNHRYADSERKKTKKGELKYFLTNCCSHQGEGIPGAGRRSCRW